MNDSINYSGFVEMFVDSYEDYDFYGNNLSDADAVTAKSSVLLNMPGESEYTFSDE